MTRRIHLGLLCLLLLALSSLAMSQSATSGQIAGTVTDPTGAVVSGAKVTLTSDAGVKRELTSDATGHYAFPLLQPGVYELEVNAAGFNPAKLKEIKVQITISTLVNIPLTVEAARGETINVSALPPLVQTDSATNGRVVEQSSIRQLPLPTRNFQQLLALTPGATGAIANSSELGRGDAVISVNGNRTTSNDVVINGIDANAIGTGSTPNLAVPATDSMQEFIVQTSLWDASNGRNTGGVVAAVTKSGTNKFHGNIYEFYRDAAMNSNNYFLKKQGTARPGYHRNQFGGTLGGPIVKDKFWFFTSYQGTREKNGTSLLNSLSTINVPGNLTSSVDRTSDAALSALAKSWGGGFFNSGGYVDPVAKAILQTKLPNGSYLIPNAAPGCANTAVACAVTIPTMSTFQEDQFNANLDYKLSDKNSLNAKFFWANNPTTQGLFSFAGVQNPLQAPGAPTSVFLKNRVLSVGDTHVFSPNVLNDAKFGFNFITVNSDPSEPFSAAQWGISSPLGSLYPQAPTISIFNNADFNAAPTAANFSQNQTYSFTDTLTWTHGRHTFKFGGDYEHQAVNLDFYAYTRGQLYYLDLLAPAWGSFIGGMPTVSIIGSGDPERNIRANDFATFFQDDWRVSPKLTLNLGVRWDLYGPFTETKGRFVAIDSTKLQTAPITGGVAVTGGFVQAGNGNLPGVPKVSDGLVDRDWNNIGPRFGFSFRPFSKSDTLVFRGGYGVYYDRMNSRLFNSQVFNAPYYSVALNIVALTSVIPAAGYLINTADPFIHVGMPNTYPLDMQSTSSFPFGGYPAIMTKTYVPNGFGTPTSTPVTPTYVQSTGIYPDVHNFVTPYTQQYNFGFEWEPMRNWLVDVGFVGSTGQRLTRQRNMNQAVNTGAAGPYYPALSYITSAPLGTYKIQTSARSGYNAMQASLTKRYSNGLQFLASYTWSHSIDDYSGGDVNDLLPIPGDTNKDYYGSSDFDRRHRFVASYVYDLPSFYKGGSGFVKQVVNGWEIAGITTLQTGVPFSVYDASFFKNVYADLKPGYTLESTVYNSNTMGRLNQYFNTAAFKVPTTGTPNFGTVPRNYFRGPGQANWDFSVVKFFPITESQKIEFRTEIFNIFNHTNFANPVGQFSSPNFGKIIRTSTGPRVIQFGAKYTF
jgi:hypothetical protein